MYTQEDYERFNQDNFDFSNFDWKRAKADFKAWTDYCHGKRQSPKYPKYSWDARVLHVTRCLANGTKMEAIEASHSRTKLYPSQISTCIERYQLEAASEAA